MPRLLESNVSKLNLLLFLLPALFSIHTAKAETFCMWTINEPKGKMNEDNMKGQCERKEVKGTKNYTEVYSVQGRMFKIEYLGLNNGLKQKVKINGKIGTATEDNRYAKNMTTDDLSIDFSYDEVLPDKSLSLAKLQGVWAKEPRSGCKPDKNGGYSSENIVFSGNKLTRFGSESQCDIYMLGKSTTATDINMVLAKCQNEEDSDKEMFSYSLAEKGRELWWQGINHYYRCTR